MTPDPISRRLVALAEVVLCSSIPTQLAIAFVLRLMGWPPTDPAGRLSLAYVLMLSLGDVVLLVGLMLVLMRAHGERPAALWIGRRSVGREAVIGLLYIPVVFAAVIALLNLFKVIAPGLHNVTENPLEHLASTPGQAALFALVAILAGGVREELQRAFLLDRFERHLGGALAGVVVLSIGFGLGHIVQGWDAVMTTGLLGAGWAIVYLRRRSTIAPIVSHAGFDALQILQVALFR
jgi:uncharacterized protein